MEKQSQILLSSDTEPKQPPISNQQTICMHSSSYVPNKISLCSEFKERYMHSRQKMAKTTFKFMQHVQDNRKKNTIKQKIWGTEIRQDFDSLLGTNDEMFILPKIECNEQQGGRILKASPRQDMSIRNNEKCMRYSSFNTTPYANLSMTSTTFEKNTLEGLKDNKLLHIKSAKQKTGVRKQLTNKIVKKNRVQKTKQIQRILRATIQNKGICQKMNTVSIRDYNRRCGNPLNSKIFIFNSQDEYIRKILLKKGWIQNMTNQSSFYHLRWTYLPIPMDNIRTDYSHYQNHFKNSHQLTSKSHLTNNLIMNQSSFGRTENYYPKCFQIGSSAHTHAFMQEYRYQIMLILLQKIYYYCQQKSPALMSQYTQLYKYHYGMDKWTSDPSRFKKYKQKSIYKISTKQQKHRTCSDKNNQFRTVIFEDFKNRNESYLLNMNLVIEGMRYWRFYRKAKQQVCDHQQHHLQYKRQRFINMFELLQKYALLTDIGKPIRGINEFKKQFYATPSKLLIQRICKQYIFLKNIGEIRQVFGMNNIWIVKPASTARGYGIYLATDISAIVHSTKGVHSRIVQKYIEKPLIIKDAKYPQICHKKFDIRQWVLLKSLNPLKIYMFSHCYLRLCYSDYDVNDISDPSKHLTNYSVNKHKFGPENKSASVLPITYLIDVLEDYGISWHRSVREQIKDIIVKSVKSCEENMEEGSERGNFALLGYDILLDEQMKPWLLQVNMSPACKQRTEWLSQYLQSMGQSLLNIIFQNFQPKQNNDNSLDYSQKSFLNDTYTQLRQSLLNQYQWELIHEQNYGPNRRQLEICLQVSGKSVKLPNERHIDWLHSANKSAMKIQRFMKNYIPKYVKYKNQKNKCICRIENYIKSFIIHKTCKLRVKQAKINVIFRYFEVNLIAKLYYNKCQQFYAKYGNLYVQGFLQWLRYCQQVRMQKVFKYRKAVLTFKYVIQLKNICRDVKLSYYNCIKIQRKCRQFLSQKNLQKLFFEKYFSTVITQAKYVKLYQKQRKQLKTTIINTHLKTIIQCKTYHHMLNNYHLTRLSVYIRCLVHRQQFYMRKLQIFYYILGRILRVKKKKIRGSQLQGIISIWKQQKDRLNTQKLAEYILSFHAAVKCIKIKSKIQLKINRHNKRQKQAL